MARSDSHRICRAFALGGALLTGFAAAAPLAHAEKYASIVMDADTGEILHARNADDPRFPASLTKVMTLYLLFDAIEAGKVDLDDRMTVSANAARQPPSNLKLKAGDRIMVEDAIYALITKSANDVAVVVAEHLAGTEKRFASRMTAKARDLGMNDTTFKNASGLPDPAQTSTATDLAILADALIDNHSRYYHYFEIQQFRWGRKTYTTHNDLLGVVDGVDGIKTGYTRASGFNLMTSAKRNGRRIVTVMLGGQTAKSRNAHVEALVEAAFASMAEPGSNGQPMAMRPSLSFASIPTPPNPNAAAEPTLNGRPLSSFLPAASGPAPVELGDLSTDEGAVVEGDGADEFEAVFFDTVPDTAPNPAATVPILSAGGLTPAEYQARQTAAPAPGSSVADYIYRQTQR